MESTSFTPVDPMRPIAPYVGGKRFLAQRLAALIGSTPHTTYAEPFVGMGGVFLRRAAKPKCEIVNDASREISNLFRMLQIHYQAFLDLLRFQITTRAEFDRLIAVDPETLTDLQRAARFLYLQRTAFAGKVVGQTFGVAHARPGTFDLSKLAPMLAELHERLAGVVIERLPFERFIPRYDTPETLFYCDPPYWGSKDYYGAELFSRADFDRLRDALRVIKGRFILSINDCPEIRTIFAELDMTTAETTYCVSRDAAKRVSELIIVGPRRA